MDYPFISISDENDLDIYEEYINECDKNAENNVTSASLYSFLQENINKTVRIDFYNSKNTECKMGILSSVGKDFMILYQPRYKRKIYCDLKSVKFITVMGNLR